MVDVLEGCVYYLVTGKVRVADMKRPWVKSEVGLEVSIKTESTESGSVKKFSFKFVGVGLVLLLIATPNFESLKSWLMGTF